MSASIRDRLIRENPGQRSVTPNGNGGALRALVTKDEGRGKKDEGIGDEG
jgi:hypothetical protein